MSHSQLKESSVVLFIWELNPSRRSPPAAHLIHGAPGHPSLGQAGPQLPEIDPSILIDVQLIEKSGPAPPPPQLLVLLAARHQEDPESLHATSCRLLGARTRWRLEGAAL